MLVKSDAVCRGLAGLDLALELPRTAAGRGASDGRHGSCLSPGRGGHRHGHRRSISLTYMSPVLEGCEEASPGSSPLRLSLETDVGEEAGPRGRGKSALGRPRAQRCAAKYAPLMNPAHGAEGGSNLEGGSTDEEAPHEQSASGEKPQLPAHQLVLYTRRAGSRCPAVWCIARGSVSGSKRPLPAAVKQSTEPYSAGLICLTTKADCSGIPCNLPCRLGATSETGTNGELEHRCGPATQQTQAASKAPAYRPGRRRLTVPPLSAPSPPLFPAPRPQAAGTTCCLTAPSWQSLTNDCRRAQLRAGCCGRHCREAHLSTSVRPQGSKDLQTLPYVDKGALGLPCPRV